jgi:hypothetical protein
MRATRFALAGLCVLLALPALAQNIAGAIRGTVVDASQAVLVGAKVTVKGEGTGFTRTTTTNADGLYSFSELPVGNYRVEVEVSGFKGAAKSNIVLNVAETRVADFQLETGEVSETVTVEAAAVAVQTVGGNVAGLISGQEARELPLNGRNFIQLTLLMPGVTLQEGRNTSDKGLQGGSDVSVSGASTTSNMWTVDGANNNDVGSNRTLLVYPSVDAIQEFKIERNNYGAEFGGAGGAQVNLVTRAGTNDFHGSAYWFARRDSLESKNYFLEQANQPKQKLHWDDYGATFGGPVVKDKLHFFLSFEKNSDKRQDVRTSFVPTAAERNGDFSGPALAGCTLAPPIDPLTGQAFPGNRIPADRLNPAGQLFLQQYSLPNVTPSAGCNNWLQAIDTPISWRQLHARIDYNLSDSTRLMVRYTQDSWDATNLNQGMWGDDPWPIIGSSWSQPSKSLVAQLNKNIGSTMVNSLTFSYSANKIDVQRSGENPELAGQINGAIPTFYPPDGKERGGAATPLTWGSGPYGNLWNQAPWNNNQDLFVLKDDFSAVFGKHVVKVGVLGSFNKKNEEVNNTSQGDGVVINGPAGYLDANGVYHSGTITGNPLADFLLSGAVFSTSEAQKNKNMLGRWKDFETYVSDSFKVSPHVTLDLGLRVSHLPQPYLADYTYSSFDPTTIDRSISSPCNGLVYPPGHNPCPALGLAGGTEASDNALAPEKFLVFGPRVGVAWDISGDGTQAIRAGIGRFYSRERVSLANNLGGNAPYVQTTSLNRTLNVAADASGQPSLGFGGANFGRELRAAVPNNWQWNLSYQRELVRNTTVQIAYVGSKGQDLTGHYDANQVAPADRLLYAQTGNGNLRPYGFLAGNNQIIINTHDRHSIYHALQTQVVSRFGNGSQFQVSYTFSKLLANDPLNNSSAGQNADAMLSDNTNPDLDYGRALIDRTHIFNASLVYNLPSLEDKTGFVKNVFGNWQVASIVTAASGVPLTIYSGGIPGLQGGGSPSGTGQVSNNNGRPNRVVDQPCHVDSGNPLQWLNPAAFTLDGFQIGQIGTSGRGVCTGPGNFQVDLALYKNIPLGKTVKLQLRVEGFNIFNRSNFLGNSVATGYNPSNIVFDTGNPATATSIVSATPQGNFGTMNQVRDPRLVQLGMRLSF